MADTWPASRLRALAFFATQRLEAMPDVPTAEEVGLSGLVVSSWLGLVAPANTPAPVVTRIQDALKKTLSRPEVAGELTKQGTLASFLPANEFRAFIASEQQRWAEVVREAGIKLE
jgi:tripartite-type tricarboxylate transporter receptor subunit TctC